MKIIALQAENIKKLVAVEVRPDGNLVQITGKNGQGKTSVLDAIWWALAGVSNIQSDPIRKGQSTAKIRLDMGEIVVTRTFKAKEDGEVTSGITVENAEGARFTSPQSMLDGLLGSLSFDPLAFSRMEPKEQFNALRKFVPDVDFDAIDAANKADYQSRTELNRRAKEARIQADKIIVTTVVKDQPIDEAALVTKLENAGKTNTDIETRKANREKLAGEARSKREEIGRLKKSIEDQKKRIAEIQSDIELRSADVLGLEKTATEIEVRLQSAPALPEPVDTTVIKGEIENAKRINAAITAYSSAVQQKEAVSKAAENLEREAAILTDKMAERELDKHKKIGAAQLPVQSLTFGDGIVLMDGVPFEQASDAQQLTASIKIAMAMNPKLRVIRVRDGSLLDQESLALLGKIAAENDFQCWIERVDSSGKVGFVLEDGHIKQQTKE